VFRYQSFTTSQPKTWEAESEPHTQPPNEKCSLVGRKVLYLPSQPLSEGFIYQFGDTDPRRHLYSRGRHREAMVQIVAVGGRR